MQRGSFRRDLAALWVAGAAVLVLAAGHVVLHRADQELYEWGQYVLIGTALPALVVLVALCVPAGSPGQVALGAVGALGAGAFVVAVFGRALAVDAPVAALHWLAASAVLARATAAGWRPRLAASAVPLLVLIVAWTVSVRLPWWETFEFSLGQPAFATAVAAATVLAVAACGAAAAPRRRRRAAAIAGWLVALATFAVGAFRTNGLFANLQSLYHWSYFVATTATIRQGGWLLWDVPSIYGFLNLLAIAALPVASPWQSLYLVNGVLLVVSAMIVFACLRWRGGAATWWLALATTASAVFLLPGSIRGLWGPTWYPSIGPLRFVWCHVLLLVLLLAHRGAVRRATLLAAGSLAWVAGVLWSSESAAVSSAVWLPAHALLAVRAGRDAGRDRARRTLGWLALPPALLAAAIAAVEAYYRIAAGHAPDWYAFVEASAWTAAGNEVVAIPLRGGTWCFLLVGCVIGTIAARLLVAGRSAPDGALALAAGAWGALWATFGYFVPLSHEFSLLSLQPVLMAVVGIALRLSRDVGDARLGLWLRMACVPAIATVLAAGYGFPNRLAAIVPPEVTSPVDRLLPAVDDDVATLLARAGVRPDDPLVHVDLFDFLIRPAKPYRPAGVAPWVGHREWLPFDLCTGEKVTPDRRALYLRRWFATRPREAGWLLVTKGAPDDLSALLAPTHRVTRAVESERFTLLRFEPQ